MTQCSRNRYAEAFRVGGRAKRLVTIGITLLTTFSLVMTLMIHPTAYAANAGSTHRANDMVTGQLSDAGSATVLVYMNGSDLESEGAEASFDIAEMLESGIGANANVVIETLGTKEWLGFDIASDHTQRYLVNQGKLKLVDDSLGQLDTTDPDTLSDFIKWGVSKYPADRYILVLWDHGAGPVYGFGYDEFQSEESALTLDEMKQALEANPNVHFDIIGMDCCIMGSLETCLVLQPYCDYMVVSEDFEPGIGWSYAGWMSMLDNDPSVNTVELGKIIVDDMIADVAADEGNGDATLALIDESKVDELYTAWTEFAYESEDDLLGSNYSQETQWRSRPNMEPKNDSRFHGFGGFFENSFDSDEWRIEYGLDDWGLGYDSNEWGIDWESWDYDGSFVTMTDYFVTDIMDVATSISNDQASALQAAFTNAMVHYGSTSGEEGMNGLGVTLPYGDAEFYDQLVKVFGACGIDRNYINWLEAFVGAEGISGYNAYGSNYDSYEFEGPSGYGNNTYGFDGYAYDFFRDYNDYDTYGYDIFEDYSGYNDYDFYGYDDFSSFDTRDYGGYGGDDLDGYGNYGDYNPHSLSFLFM